MRNVDDWLDVYFHAALLALTLMLLWMLLAAALAQ